MVSHHTPQPEDPQKAATAVGGADQPVPASATDVSRTASDREQFAKTAAGSAVGRLIGGAIEKAAKEVWDWITS
ncbi:hypothetical protein [Nocardia gipuzkoensis]